MCSDGWQNNGFLRVTHTKYVAFSCPVFSVPRCFSYIFHCLHFQQPVSSCITITCELSAFVLLCYCRRTGDYVRTLQSFDRRWVVERDSAVHRRRQPARRRRLHPLASLGQRAGLVLHRAIPFYFITSYVPYSRPQSVGAAWRCSGH